jgi:predicted RecB family endonuclease
MLDTKLKLIIGVALLAATFAMGWTANGWRLNSKIDRLIADHERQVAQANADALARYSDLERKKQEAVNEANKIAQRNARAATDARNDLERLRNQITDTASGMPTATCTSVRAHATTLSTVLAECVGRLEAVAKDADGHALDSRTLNDAWPR